MSDQTQNRNGPAEFEKVLTTAATDVASFDEDHKSPLRRLQHFLHANPTSIPIIVLILGIIGFGLYCEYIGRSFFALSNFGFIVQQVTVVSILAIGQTLVIMTAGIDLSIGVIMVLSHIVMGKLAIDSGVPVPIAFALGLVCGTACGLLNGALITYLQLPPFIATLGTWNIFNSILITYSKSQTIRSDDLDATAPFLKFMGTPFLADLFTYGAILALFVAACIWYVMNRTAFGRHVLATGDDTEAARLAGIRTDRTLLATYAVAGFIAAVAGWALVGRVGAVSPNSAQTANLDSITAVVIGGTSLFGGRGSIVGTLVGALIVGVFSSGTKLANLGNVGQIFAVGCLIIIAVAIDQWIRKVSA